MGGPVEKLPLRFYSDVDYAGDEESLTSIPVAILALPSRHTLMPATAKPKAQPNVFISAPEAETTALSMVVRLVTVGALC